MRKHYTSIPEVGYDGKRSSEERLHGIERLEAFCAGRTVLDLGCAEGVVARELARYGARLVHGVDRYGERLVIAERLFSELATNQELSFSFIQGYFQDIATFRERHKNQLLQSYDIVLLLGLLHTSTEAEALEFTRQMLPLCDE